MFLQTSLGKICYKKTGKHNFIVFLHGLGGDLSVWNFMEEACREKGLGFLSIDLPGHGYSDRLKSSVSMNDLSATIKEVMDFEKIDKAIIVGHCFGGMVGLNFCNRNRERVDKLILINSTPFIPIWMKADYFLKILKLINISHRKEYVNFEKYKNTGDYNVIRLLSDLRHVGSRSYFELSRSIIEWSEKFALFINKFPVLMIVGKRDKILPMKKQLILARSMKNTEIRLVESNHLIPLNKQNELKNLIFENI